MAGLAPCSAIQIVEILLHGIFIVSVFFFCRLIRICEAEIFSEFKNVKEKCIGSYIHLDLESRYKNIDSISRCYKQQIDLKMIGADSLDLETWTSGENSAFYFRSDYNKFLLWSGWLKTVRHYLYWRFDLLRADRHELMFEEETWLGNVERFSQSEGRTLGVMGFNRFVEMFERCGI